MTWMYTAALVVAAFALPVVCMVSYCAGIDSQRKARNV
jgi:hypothetical protein